MDAIIFVIDSSDSLRLIVIKEELELLLKNQQIQSKPYLPILFCANKMDLKEALSSLKIVEHLALNQIGERPWHIQSTNALTGEGLGEAIQWLSDQLSQTKK